MSTWKEAFRPTWQVGINFHCTDLQITSLEGAPSHVEGNFNCSYNDLTSLHGAPSFIRGFLSCRSCRLASLDEVPAYIGASFFCTNNALTSLKDIHLRIKHIGKHAHFDGNPIKSHVLGLLLINGLQEVQLDSKDVQGILNKHFPSKGMESVLLAQEELIQAGLDEFAQL